MRLLLGLALGALCDARRMKMPKIAISTDTPGGDCPPAEDNGGCCTDCEYNRYCRSSGGCHSAEQPGCEVDLCPAPVSEPLVNSPPESSPESFSSPSPSPEPDLSADSPLSQAPMLEASPEEFPDGIAALLAEAVATRNELEEMHEGSPTPSPTPAPPPAPAGLPEDFPDGIAELLAEAVATRNELEEMHDGSPTPSPTPAPTPSPEPELEVPTPSPVPDLEAGPSPSPAPEELFDTIADLR